MHQHQLIHNQHSKMMVQDVNHKIKVQIIHVNHVYIKSKFHNLKKHRQITKENKHLHLRLNKHFFNKNEISLCMND